MFAKELQELINTAIREGKGLEEVEKQTEMSFTQVGDPEELKRKWEEAKKVLDINQKKFDEELREYEPYDLSEIIKISSKANKTISKINSRDKKVMHLSLVLEKIKLIINNSKSAYYHLEQNDAINSPQDFWNEIEKAENIMKQIEIKIQELQLAEPETSDIYQRSKLKETASLVKTSNSEQSKSDDNLTLKEAAQLLRISKSKLYHSIPKDEKHRFRIGGKYSISRDRIEELRTVINNRPNVKVSKSKIINHHFSFKVPIEPFTRVFIEKGYLDEENGKMFSERLKSCVLINNLPKIEWKDNKIKSLMTFIIVSQKLELINADESAQRQDSDSGDLIILLEPFFSNFNRNKKGWSESSISRAKRNVINALDKIEDKAKSMNNKQGLSFRESLELLLSNKIHMEIKDKIDIKILEIMQACIS